MEVNIVCSRFSSGVRLAFVGLFLLMGSSLAHSAPLTATLMTNKGCGTAAVFNIGESITDVLTVSNDAYVTLNLYRPDGTVSTRLSNQFVRGGVPVSLVGVIGAPVGQRRLTLDAVSGQETAHAECFYTAQASTTPLAVTLQTNKGCGTT